MLTINIDKKRYSSNIILKDIQVSIAKNGLYGIVGKNGSGKTTFFQCIAHLHKFQGEILYQNQKLLPQQVAFLPTEPFLYEHLTVREFYTFYRKMADISQPKAFTFDIDSSLLIKELSTGMRKKVYFNAVFQKDYDLYIFDEPFNGLDIEAVFGVKRILKKLAENHIVLVSSHILETLQDCEKLFLINNQSVRTFDKNDIHTIENILLTDL